jgi:hypothetical protein
MNSSSQPLLVLHALLVTGDTNTHGVNGASVLIGRNEFWCRVDGCTAMK